MSNEKGQSLLELVVVIAVAIIVIAALVFTTIASLRNANFAKNQSQATKLAQEGLEKIRSVRDRDGKVTDNAIQSTPPVSKFSDLWSASLSCANTGCYFKLTKDSAQDALTNVNSSCTNFINSCIENLGNGLYRRIEIEDVGDGTQEKKITSYVIWTDFSGSHQSKLTTILGKI